MPFDLNYLLEQRPGNPIHYFATAASTMTEAALLAGQDAPHGTVIVADQQTQGVGRLGRSWHSPPESGLYCSIILRLPLPPDRLPLITLTLGLATREAIQTATNLACDLRWPNDVLIDEKKTAGILAQLVDSAIVAGIGVNVNHDRFPSDLRTPATSLKIESHGQTQSREALLVHLLSSLDSFCSTLLGNPRDILKAFAAASSYALNRRVIIEESGRHGTTAGLDTHGFLLVRYDSGAVERVTTGGLRPEA